MKKNKIYVFYHLLQTDFKKIGFEVEKTKAGFWIVFSLWNKVAIVDIMATNKVSMGKTEDSFQLSMFL